MVRQSDAGIAEYPSTCQGVSRVWQCRYPGLSCSGRTPLTVTAEDSNPMFIVLNKTILVILRNEGMNGSSNWCNS